MKDLQCAYIVYYYQLKEKMDMINKMDLFNKM